MVILVIADIYSICSTWQYIWYVRVGIQEICEIVYISFNTCNAVKECIWEQDLGNYGPDFTYGYGSVNSLRSIAMIEHKSYIDSSINVNDSIVLKLTLPANQRLKTLLYWHDIPASTPTTQALINNLDLYIIAPNGDNIYPFILDPSPSGCLKPATTGLDSINHAEQIDIISTIAGEYQIVIKDKQLITGSQDFILAYDILPHELTMKFPAGGENLFHKPHNYYL